MAMTSHGCDAHRQCYRSQLWEQNLSVVLNLMSISLTTAAIPYLSEMAAAENWSGSRRTLNTYSKLLLGLSVPLTLLLILGSRLIVRVLLQRGAFTAADAAVVAHVQVMYALQMPFFAVFSSFAC